MSHDLMVIDRGTGEAVVPVDAGVLLAAAGLHDVQAAELAELGAFDQRVRELKSIADEAAQITGREVIRRLDRRGQWTVREDGFEFKAPSPQAGTVAYDVDELRDALTTLIDADVIDTAAARAALQVTHPTVGLTAVQLDEIIGALQGTADFPAPDHVLAGVRAARDTIREAKPSYTPRLAGIKALLKLGGPVAAAIEGCQVPVQPPARKPKITPMRAA